MGTTLENMDSQWFNVAQMHCYIEYEPLVGTEDNPNIDVKISDFICSSNRNEFGEPAFPCLLDKDEFARDVAEIVRMHLRKAMASCSTSAHG